MAKFKVGEKVYWYDIRGAQVPETITSIVNDKAFMRGGGFLYFQDLHKDISAKPRPPKRTVTVKECNGSTCDIVLPIPQKKLKTVFVWQSLDRKKGDRLAEVIREAVEKHGEVTITIE